MKKKQMKNNLEQEKNKEKFRTRNKNTRKF